MEKKPLTINYCDSSEKAFLLDMIKKRITDATKVISEKEIPRNEKLDEFNDMYKRIIFETCTEAEINLDEKTKRISPKNEVHQGLRVGVYISHDLIDFRYSILPSL